MSRVVFFGSGSPMSTYALDAVAARATIVGVVVPGVSGGGLRSLRRRWARRRALRALAHRARALGAPLLRFAPGGGEALAQRLPALRPDLFCVATFPYLLSPELLALAPRGALGLHPSLLPRRRGPDPLFWTYLDGDHETGVSLIRLDGGEDTGPLVAQEAVPVPRGLGVHELYDQLARRGGALMAQAVGDLEEGALCARPQPEAAATRQPAPGPSTCRVELAECEAERLWHFLRGVGPRRAALRAQDGALLLHGPARRYGRERLRAPGEVERRDGLWRLHCRDGYVEVEAVPALRALLARLARRGARVLA